MTSGEFANAVFVMLKTEACGRAFEIEVFGGAEGDRTPDLMTASHALSQLSYGPTRGC